MRPTSEAELADAVREAASSGTKLEIRGGGTRPIGDPVQADATLETGSLTGISLYEPGALTVVAQAGTALSEIEAALAAEGQMLPFEPPRLNSLLGTTGESTIGGVVATAASGPRRIKVGACRDSLIGVRFVDGRGDAIKNGGRVMKNVTGYDLVKLMAGSHGTLGVLTEVSFKVLPRPQSTAVLLFEGLSDSDAAICMAEAMGSPFDVSGAAHLPIGLDEAPVTMIRLEGLTESVTYRAGALAKALRAHGTPRIETDPERTAAGWRHVRDAEPFAGKDGDVWRVSVKPSDGPQVADAAKALAHFYDWQGGLVWLLTEPGTDLRARLTGIPGHATLIRGAGQPAFHPEPAPLAKIAAELRAQFDPHAILNPGRMG
ncbi:glycolate oxidase subunit GlcE [Pontivivens ytuae]|uniref:Glycolate oxidase subunit GlcE n=1 Tax=Pontivivens ytuae TaxID=2789856 RepID=A0A7S9LWF2_9RHOB|nr:glycolate oxidase subunit GlcE [Pontivivens ytuae]QPH56230.1 glycolate oxidase subunit GlcE [Pontivivens ytuae]